MAEHGHADSGHSPGKKSKSGGNIVLGIALGVVGLGMIRGCMGCLIAPAASTSTQPPADYHKELCLDSAYHGHNYWPDARASPEGHLPSEEKLVIPFNTTCFFGPIILPGNSRYLIQRSDGPGDWVVLWPEGDSQPPTQTEPSEVHELECPSHSSDQSPTFYLEGRGTVTITIKNEPLS